MKKEWITLHDIHEARVNMKKSGLIYPTLVKYCPTLSNQFKGTLYHCAETVQPVKSFKIRGALNAIMHLTPAQKKKGVICASAGNHAQGTALSASTLGIKSYICMPSNAPLAKIQATKNFGGNVILAPEPSFDAAYALSKKLAKERGLTEIPPYDHPMVIAGQATVAADILDKQPDIDMFIVPIGGGGLIAGIATYVKMLDPKIVVVGVQAENFPAMKKSFDEKKIVSYSKGVPTLADGCAVKTPGDITFDIIKERVDKIVTVTEDEIARAINLLVEKGKFVAEGAGAMPTAAVMAGKVKVKGKKVAMLISGGNIDIDMLEHACKRALTIENRRFKTIAYFKSEHEINDFVKYLGEHNAVAWTLDTEVKVAKGMQPGTYLIGVICPDSKTSEEVKDYVRKQKFFVRCF